MKRKLAKILGIVLLFMVAFNTFCYADEIAPGRMIIRRVTAEGVLVFIAIIIVICISISILKEMSNNNKSETISEEDNKENDDK